jgi:thiamine-phosphate pyrophosphorylase
MDRIVDANLNRATEAVRVLEEIARFYLDNKTICEKLKTLRHKISKSLDENYKELLTSRNTEEDVGTDIPNPSNRKNIINIHVANFKRLQQALRTLSEYSPENATVFEEARYSSYTLEKEMFDMLSEKLNKIRLKDRKLYLVTDGSKFKNNDQFLDAVASALKGGVQIVQLREKTATAKEFIELGKKVRELCYMFDALFIVNDRVDIAKIVKADGVHLGQDDIDIADARKILGDMAIMGISTHSSEQALKAIESGADYIGVGPVFETPTKPNKKSVGLEYVQWASENVEIPWFAIGGINADNIGEVVKSGASKIAVVRSIINADSPEKAASDFISTLQI